MKLFSFAAPLCLFALQAAAQTTSTGQNFTEQQKCVNSTCGGNYADLSCVAACFGVPNPNSDMVGKTNECYDECRKNGSTGAAADSCIDNCVKKFYNPEGSAVPQPAANPTATTTTTNTSQTGTKTSTNTSKTGSTSASSSKKSSATRPLNNYLFLSLFAIASVAFNL
ncbi:hypothetical protein BB561_003216 [Smittium simulii]|uniref:Extracellular membrane protein CFEM domain-containing protein n=1 Tax=Smittium simulii TaxID=133385 RepID=A0A2T9YMF8_9FUNG|nr:hypothetical protein BB561_003217 [Smittium simulii]PVU93534.1 hypothetical protein BB561_003216 [Smittium simulii]